MKILLNLSILNSGGGIQVAMSVLEEWKNFTDHEFCVILSEKNRKYFTKENFPEKFEFHVISSSPRKLFNRLSILNSIRSIEIKFSPDVVFTLFGPSYWKPCTTHLCGYALPHHIYPESPYFKLIPGTERIKWKVKRFLQFLSFKHHCQYLVTETHDASRRLVNNLNINSKNVFTVNNAYHGVFNDNSRWKHIEGHEFSVNDFKLITISSYYPHKNLNIIPDVVTYLIRKYPGFAFTFILTIDNGKLGELTDEQENHIQFIGKVDIEECPPLYQHANALFMPTLLECFTVSYLEAMKMERPILTSDLPFARELCGQAASYFDPLDPASIGDKIFELAQNTEKQEHLKQLGAQQLKKYGSARDRAVAYLDILEKIYIENREK